jgi:hypothetical protein
VRLLNRLRRPEPPAPTAPLPATVRFARWLVEEAASHGLTRFTLCERDGRSWVFDDAGEPVLRLATPWFVLRETLRSFRDGWHPDGPARAERAALPIQHDFELLRPGGALLGVRLLENPSAATIVVGLVHHGGAPLRRAWKRPQPDAESEALLREVHELVSIIVLE